MTAKQVTNVVFAMLPCRDDVDHTLAIMRNFGEVGACKVWEDAEGLLEVAYYDVRAAERALEELGETRCWRAQPCGNRIVRLPGSAGLDQHVVGQIRDMFVDDNDPNYYILEFYDVRDASDHRQLITPDTDEKLREEWHPKPLKLEAEVPEAPPMPEMRPMPSEEMPDWWTRWPEDRTMMSIAEQSSAQMGMITPGTFLVVLQGVPRELLNDLCVEAMLEQAGLLADVGKFTIHDEKVSLRGHCMLNVLSESGVYRCLNHFAGCCWGCRATLVYGDLSMSSMPACYPATQNSEGMVWSSSSQNRRTCAAEASDEYDFERAEADWPKVEFDFRSDSVKYVMKRLDYEVGLAPQKESASLATSSTVSATSEAAETTQLQEQAEKAAVIDLKLLGELKDRQWPGG